MHGVLLPASPLAADGLCYRSLVELIPDAVWITSGGKVVYANPAAQRLFAL